MESGLDMKSVACQSVRRGYRKQQRLGRGLLGGGDDGSHILFEELKYSFPVQLPKSRHPSLAQDSNPGV